MDYVSPHISIAGIAMSLLAGSGTSSEGPANARAEEPRRADAAGNYTTVNGLKMYYEIRGEGEPLVLLHGAFGLAMDLPALAKNRRVIAVELQGHGHTADIDRPLSVEQMADDTAALLKELKIDRADFFGYSMGGVVALGVAIRHPWSLVRKNWPSTAPISAAWKPPSSPRPSNNSGTFLRIFAATNAESPVWDKGRTRPDEMAHPGRQDQEGEHGVQRLRLGTISRRLVLALVLITLGDRDGIRPSDVVEMFRADSPTPSLPSFRGTDHFLEIFQSPEKLLPMIRGIL